MNEQGTLVTHLLSSHCVHWVGHRFLLLPTALLLLFYLSGTCPLLPSLELTAFYSSDDYRGLSSPGEVPDHSSEGSYVHTDRPEDVGSE